MGRKKVLERRLQRLTAKKNDLVTRSQTADVTVEELREIQSKIADVQEDIAEVQEELELLTEDSPNNNGGDEENEEQDNPDDTERQIIPNSAELRGGHPIASYSQNTRFPGVTQRRNETGFASFEYRMAFKDYVQRGTPIPSDVLTRAGGDTGATVTTDIGTIIPETIMNEFIKEVSKAYGNIYAKVRKLNIKGGVKFPISKLKANFKWITESTVSEKQKAGDLKDYVVFEYNIGEIRVAETLLAQIVSLDLFETEITKIMIEAYVEAMDKGIISGTGSGQLLGITKDPRVTKNKSNIIEMTAEEFGDWVSWRKKFFAKIPLSKRGKGEFLFPASTVESYLMTMKDKNDRPLWKDPEYAMSENGSYAGNFFGRVTDYVEPDVIADFDTAAVGDIVGIFWVPTDYAINTNLQFGIKRFFDENTNEWINKGLTIVDGKILDVSGCYLIKKAANASGEETTG